jgi:hypothetical protein
VSDRATGATEAQIEAACQSRMQEQFAVADTADLTAGQRHHVESMVRVIAPHLVPLGSLIIDADDFAALWRIYDGFPDDVTNDDLTRLAALIGDKT